MTKNHTLLSLNLVLIIATNTLTRSRICELTETRTGDRRSSSSTGVKRIFWAAEIQIPNPGDLVFISRGAVLCSLSVVTAHLSAPLIPSPYLCPQVNFVILLINGVFNSQASNRPGHPVINTFKKNTFSSLSSQTKKTFLLAGIPQVNSWVGSTCSSSCVRSFTKPLSRNILMALSSQMSASVTLSEM